jgi:hypothetical protein
MHAQILLSLEQSVNSKPERQIDSLALLQFDPATFGKPKHLN